MRTEAQTVLLCKIRGNLRLKGFEATNPLTVGDKVDIEMVDGDETAWVTGIHERKNYIIRKSIKLSKQVQILAANIDRAFVVATPAMPKTSTGFLDRFLATAEAYAIPGGIIWNKCDLYDEPTWDFIAEMTEVYEAIGYKVFAVSAAKGIGLDELKSELNGKISLLSGHSGVGKSSLINALVPGLALKTGGLSSQHQKGTHTTTFAEMHTLPAGGYIIDTPGIREFGTIDFDKYEVSHFFPEIFKAGKDCKFGNCLHDQEMDCAVKRAVENGEIAISRYTSYLSVLYGEDIFR